MKLQLGMTICRGLHRFKQPNRGEVLPFATFEGALSEPSLTIQMAKQGRVLVREQVAAAELLFDSNLSLFQYADRVEYQPLLDTGADLEVVVLYVSRSVLNMLLGEHETGNLLKYLGLTKCPSAGTERIPQHISNIVFSAYDMLEQGEIFRLKTQGMVLEYLNALSVFLGQNRDVSLSPTRVKVIRQAADELMHLEGKIPPLSDFAAVQGVSLRTLNEGFKQVFNTTVYDFIKKHRLRAAHDALEQSDIAMKIVADRIGYSHVNHFITAFKKHFGYTPGSLRK